MMSFDEFPSILDLMQAIVTIRAGDKTEQSVRLGTPIGRQSVKSSQNGSLSDPSAIS
jgi:hypothetical protein